MFLEPSQYFLYQYISSGYFYNLLGISPVVYKCYEPNHRFLWILLAIRGVKFDLKLLCHSSLWTATFCVSY